MRAGLPWRSGVLQGTERLMTDVLASLQRAIKRVNGPKKCIDRAETTGREGGRRQADDTAEEKQQPSNH